MANSGVSVATRTPRAINRNCCIAPVEDENIDTTVDRENQLCLRTVDHKTGGALRRAGFKEG